MIEAAVIFAIVVFVVWLFKVWRNPYRVIIRYKSGHKVKICTSAFTVTTNYSGNKGYKWTIKGPLISEKIMNIGADDIEAVTLQARMQHPFGWFA